jgi:drug/metabolite transporter (DMT)-like permease
VAAAFAGLFLLTVPAGNAIWGDFRSVNFGDMLTLACAVAFAFQIIFVGRATERHAYQPIAFLQIATAALLMAPSVPLLEHAHIVWSWRVTMALLVTALLSTAAAFTIQSWAQQFMAATNAALIFSLEPVFAWLTAYVILGESLHLRAAFGAVLIVAGLLVSELLGSVKKNNREAAPTEVAV